MYDAFTSERVLTMEWIDGEKPRRGSAGSAFEAPVATSTALATVPPAAPRRTAGSAQDIALVEVGVRCSLEQMLQEGFYHAGAQCAYLERDTCGLRSVKPVPNHYRRACSAPGHLIHIPPRRTTARTGHPHTAGGLPPVASNHRTQVRADSTVPRPGPHAGHTLRMRGVLSL